jgi:antitoxin ParD1/3/4
MNDIMIHLDRERAEALQSAISDGGATSVQAAVESALDAWLTDHAVSQMSDEALQRLWQEGLQSGGGEPLDLAALKAAARR